MGILTGWRAKVIRIEQNDSPWGASFAVDPKFAGLVERLEREAQARPASYRRRVVAAGALGIGFVALVLAALIGICAALVWVTVAAEHLNAVVVKLALVAGLVAYAIMRSLWVRLDPPEGREVRRAEAPRLFEMIDEVRGKLQGPPIHAVLITDDFNAAIVQHPRFGVFGGYRNYLLLGLPLLQGLTGPEVRAVVAHEYGHLAGAHGRLAAWVYRIRQIWVQLSMNLAGGHTANLMRRFFAWYAPWFNAYSFVLARANEYDADRASAEMTSPRVAADALVRVSLQGRRYQGDYWQTIVDQAAVSPTPVNMPFAGASAYLATPHANPEPSLTAELALRTDLTDTHPCLSDRLAALGEPAVIPPPLTVTGADDFLGELAHAFAGELDALWWTSASEGWAAHHAERAADTKELEALNARAADGLDLGDMWRRAQLTEAVEGPTSALPLYHAIADAHPDQHAASFVVGRIRLAEGDDNGIALIVDAMDREPQLAEDGCCLILDHLYGAGREAETTPFHDRLDACRERLREAAAERAEISPAAELHPLNLEAGDLAAIRDQLAQVQGVRRVWAARRELKLDPTPQYVLVIQPKGRVDAQAACAQSIEAFELHGHTLAVSLAANTRWLHSRLKKMAGSLIFER